MARSPPDQIVADGATIGERYRLKRQLAAGGMGTVWLADDQKLGRQVALKILAHQLASHSELLTRFEREAKAVAQLRSIHVVEVYDFGIHETLPFIVMELLEGESLRARLRRLGRLSLGETLAITDQIAKGLKSAHNAGLIHRDLKPSNVFVALQDDVEIIKLLDFGVVKAVDQTGNADMTASGTLLGTPQYMSPEQVRARRRIDHRSDLWALGVIVFRMLTGINPFRGESVGDAALRICSDELPRISDYSDTLPSELDKFFERAFARDPADRYQSADEASATFRSACASLMSGVGQAAPEPAASSAAAPQPAAPGRAAAGPAASARLDASQTPPPAGASGAATPPPTSEAAQIADADLDQTSRAGDRPPRSPSIPRPKLPPRGGPGRSVTPPSGSYAAEAAAAIGPSASPPPLSHDQRPIDEETVPEPATPPLDDDTTDTDPDREILTATRVMATATSSPGQDGSAPHPQETPISAVQPVIPPTSPVGTRPAESTGQVAFGASIPGTQIPLPPQIESPTPISTTVGGTELSGNLLLVKQRLIRSPMPLVVGAAGTLVVAAALIFLALAPGGSDDESTEQPGAEQPGTEQPAPSEPAAPSDNTAIPLGRWNLKPPTTIVDEGMTIEEAGGTVEPDDEDAGAEATGEGGREPSQSPLPGKRGTTRPVPVKPKEKKPKWF